MIKTGHFRGCFLNGKSRLMMESQVWMISFCNVLLFAVIFLLTIKLTIGKI